MPSSTLPLDKPSGKIAKRLFDIIIATAGLAVTPVIIIPAILAVKLTSPGPAFFVQKRNGIRGKLFNCYKLRTMSVNDEADSRPCTPGDERITPVGHLLRHLSIDELPQLLNVLKGDMSIVGPRPHMIAQTETFREAVPGYDFRLKVKPGITGLAQTTGFRGSAKETWQMQGRVNADIRYIENWSMALDIRIIMRTFIIILAGK